MAILDINSTNFDAEVKASDNETVLVDFWAPWCGPCRALAPVLDEVDAELGDKLKVLKVNVDDNPGLASKYGVMSIPTLMVFKNGESLAKISGMQSKDQLLSWLKEYI